MPPYKRNPSTIAQKGVFQSKVEESLKPDEVGILREYRFHRIVLLQ